MEDADASKTTSSKKNVFRRLSDSTKLWLMRGLLAIVLVGAITRSCTDKHLPRIKDIAYQQETVQIYIDDGRVYEVRPDSPSYNKRNLALLYVGKEIWTNTLDNEPSGCQGIAPVKQTNMRVLSTSQYMQLVKEGFRDSEISYSFTFISDSPNPNPENPTYGGTVEYGAPQVCAFLLKKAFGS